MLKTVIQPLVSEKTIDFWAEELGLTWRWQRPIARIVARQVSAKNTVSLWLKPNKHFLGFSAGQHINLTVDVQGTRLTRSFSLSHAPRKDGLLRVTIKQNPTGTVSRYLIENAQVDDIVDISQAYGTFNLVPQKTTVLVAAGSGITPMMSLLHSLDEQQLAPIYLFYWAKTQADVCFYEELQHLSQRHKNLTIKFIFTQEAQTHGLTGRVNAELWQQLTATLDEYHVLICGNAEFVDTVKQLSSKAISQQYEAFTPPKLSNSAAQAVVRVELKQSQKVLALTTGTSLLAALEAEGIYPPSGCRMGICHTCSCQKLVGTTEDLQFAELNAESGAIKLCTSRAYSDLVLDL
ncbi:flavin reductase family protein [Agitococcus lubricus]|uniref:Ferredoxin-NADP reductase n=1 Tax=Agitococcus lubricus TaxID=1077255 RepID=A0A2T5IYV4_9GAMM|nr:iron-sulfur cluster-binding domain-containing protein [Agitococcus lubricus]PTQ89190.1 ferredoxin-NADP reductase [Agitococcus lubricus]